MKVHPLWCNE